tara:strand:- start:262 stop:477 length:216 start_codon:yes stop_codon:yes gene_type:complete
MKRTEKHVDEILKESKQELQEVAYKALQNFLYNRIEAKLASSHTRTYFCKPLIEDINEKIDLFLKAEGYEK